MGEFDLSNNVGNCVGGSPRPEWFPEPVAQASLVLIEPPVVGGSVVSGLMQATFTEIPVFTVEPPLEAEAFFQVVVGVIRAGGRIVDPGLGAYPSQPLVGTIDIPLSGLPLAELDKEFHACIEMVWFDGAGAWQARQYAISPPVLLPRP
jgi:hypothetical protein